MTSGSLIFPGGAEVSLSAQRKSLLMQTRFVVSWKTRAQRLRSRQARAGWHLRGGWAGKAARGGLGSAWGWHRAMSPLGWGRWHPPAAEGPHLGVLLLLVRPGARNLRARPLGSAPLPPAGAQPQPRGSARPPHPASVRPRGLWPSFLPGFLRLLPLSRHVWLRFPSAVALRHPRARVQELAKLLGFPPLRGG